MSIVFSASTLAFYDLELWPHGLPVDSLHVSGDLHEAILQQLSQGRQLGADAQGGPCTIEPPPPSLAALATEARHRRDQAISAVQWLIERHRGETALGRTGTTLTGEDYLLVLQYVQDLRDVPEQDGFPTAIDWPDLDPALLATGD